MYLLDTVPSELRKKPEWRNPHVVSWLGAASSDELFADALTAWLDVILRNYGERILRLTTAIARRWGRLSARIGNNGIDLAIAATALEHGLTIVTRNVSDLVARR